ncbi:MAG: flippase-like domain-containing protein [Rhodobacteraceae bacterium]|nr:flippase-like domain-containing protein [Paracoccaceae bacterium]
MPIKNMNPIPSSLRPWLWFAAKAAIGGGAFAVVISRVPLREALDAVARLPVGTAALALGLTVLAHAITAERLRLVLPGMTPGQAFRFTLIGLLYANVLPTPLAGDAVKAVRLARIHVAPGQAALAVVRDKLLGFAALAVIAVAATATGEMPPVVTAIAAGLIAAIALVWRGLSRVPWLAEKLGFGTVEGAEAPAPRHYVVNFVWGIVFQILCAVIFAVIGGALGLELDPAQWVVVYATVTLVLLLPVTVAGLGLREGTLVGVLAFFGQNEAAALALSLCLLALGLLGALAGLVAETGRDRAGA